MLEKPPLRRGLTMKISSRGVEKKNKASKKLSSIYPKFSFFPFPFTNPLNDALSDGTPSENTVKKNTGDDESKTTGEVPVSVISVGR